MYSTRFPVDQAPDPNQEQSVTLIVVPWLSKWAHLPWKTGPVDYRVHSWELTFSPQQPVEYLLGPGKGEKEVFSSSWRDFSSHADEVVCGAW